MPLPISRFGPARRDRPTATELPASSRLRARYAGSDLADAYRIGMPSGAGTDPEALAQCLFSSQARWVKHLMQVRDLLVAGLGLKTARQLRTAGSMPAAKRIGIFKVYDVAPDEIVLGEDDNHLDFRISVSVVASDASVDGRSRDVVVTTVVHCHNRLGRGYIKVIAPFHRLAVRSALRGASRRGWPTRDGSAGRS